MTGITKRAFYNAPSSQVRYHYVFAFVSAKKAPVVFIHRSASCGWCYESMMKEYSQRGHDCYAPDMPGFGGSYDPADDQTSTRYYVDIFKGLFRHLQLPKIHLVGHHSGAALALEMTSVYPDEVLTCALSAPALATRTEQEALFKILAGEWTQPKEDGSHLMKVWNTMNGPLLTDLHVKNHEVIDSVRAGKGRDQVYTCTFKQDTIVYYKEIKVPILAMCPEDDVLWHCFHYCKELQPDARCEVTTGDFMNAGKDAEGSISYYHMDFLAKMGT